MSWSELVCGWENVASDRVEDRRVVTKDGDIENFLGIRQAKMGKA